MPFRRPLLPTALALALLAAPGPALAHATPRAPEAAPAPRTVQTVAGPVTEVVLRNGLKVLLKENHAAPVVSWVVTYKVGSRNEPAGATGSAHLLEHMLFKGTKTLGKGQIAQILDRNGANSNASTWVDWTNYYETYSSDRLELGLIIEAARMRDALILDSERKSEMTVVRNELERGESNPGRVLYQHLMSTAFRAHPYHHPTIGWRSDVETVPTSQLKAFYDTYYQPNNAVAVLVGDFKTPEALRLIRRYFEGIPKGPTPPAVRTVEEPQTGERRFTLRRRGETNMLMLGWHIPQAGHADIGPLLVLDSILSTGVTGRLYQALVETELATSAYSDVGLMRDPGLFRMGATLKPAGDHAKVEAALIAELEKLRTAHVSADELAKAKAQAEAAYVYENEGTTGLAHALAAYEAIAGWRRNFTLLDDIQRTSAADIQRVARAYFTQDNRTAGWYVATPDGPVPPPPPSQAGGAATANEAKVQPAPLYAFEQRQPARRQLTPPARRVLPNGLTLIVLPVPGSQTVALDGQIQAGELHEPAGKDGLAGATAAMLDAGTARRTKLALAGDLERVSASVGFSGGTHVTDVSGACLAKDLDVMLDALAEMLTQPTFPQDELAKLKARWVAGIRRAEDQPGTHVARAFSQAVYPERHPYRQHDAAVDIRAIEALTSQDLQAFHRRYYGPNTTTLVLVGKVDPDAVATGLTRRLAGWRAAELSKPEVPDAPPSAPKRVVVPMPDKSNVEVRTGHAIGLRRRSPDYHAAQLGNYVLGGDPLSSRLGLRLRDELGLTYGTYASLSGGLGPGTWSASLTVNPANVQTGLSELRLVVARYLREGVTPRELTFAKSAFIGSQAVGLASNTGMASSLAAIELYGLGLDYWGRYPGLIGGLSAAQVNQAVRKYVLPAAAHTILVGPLPAEPGPASAGPRK